MNYIWELLRKAGGSSFELAVWGMYFGIFLACLLALYEKRVIGGFVRTLLKKEAFSPEKAMTLQELGYGKNPFVRGALRGKTALSSLVYMPGEDPEITGAPEEGDIHAQIHARPAIRSAAAVKSADARFYIPAPLRHRAALRFEQHGTHLMAVLVAVGAFALLALAILWLMPKVSSYVGDIFRSLFAGF